MLKLARLTFQGVCYTADRKDILHDLSIEFEAGDFVSIVGPSGSGKSTLLKLCCHLISPTRGAIFLDGTDIMEQNPTELRRRVAYCFQTPVLFGKTVEDNLHFPYAIRRLPPDSAHIRQLFEQFRMSEDFIRQPVHDLSGGEKQRIALIRTLLFQPEILLLDEVTSALDVENTGIVENVVADLNRRGVTVLWVTHSPEQSRKYARRLLTVAGGNIQSLEVLR